MCEVLHDFDALYKVFTMFFSYVVLSFVFVPRFSHEDWSSPKPLPLYIYIDDGSNSAAPTRFCTTIRYMKYQDHHKGELRFYL